MEAKKKIELLSLKSMSTTAAQVQALPVVIAVLISIALRQMDRALQISASNPSFPDLTAGVFFIFAGFSFLIACIRKEWISLIIIRGKLAVILGAFFFVLLFSMGIWKMLNSSLERLVYGCEVDSRTTGSLEGID